jgi:hypothetical protein
MELGAVKVRLGKLSLGLALTGVSFRIAVVRRFARWEETPHTLINRLG